MGRVSDIVFVEFFVFNSSCFFVSLWDFLSGVAVPIVSPDKKFLWALDLLVWRVSLGVYPPSTKLFGDDQIFANIFTF